MGPSGQELPQLNAARHGGSRGRGICIACDVAAGPPALSAPAFLQKLRNTLGASLEPVAGDFIVMVVWLLYFFFCSMPADLRFPPVKACKDTISRCFPRANICCATRPEQSRFPSFLCRGHQLILGARWRRHQRRPPWNKLSPDVQVPGVLGEAGRGEFQVAGGCLWMGLCCSARSNLSRGLYC